MKKIKPIFLLFITIYSFLNSKAPKITTIIVIDQFANHYINKLRPYFNYAFKDLLENGIVYANAFHPHAGPATATGHTALNTGTFACKHGIPSNKWPNKDNKNQQYEVDIQNKVSGQNIMVDGLSDHFIKNNNKDKNKKVFCLSLKSRAAIGMASKHGKPIWFEPKNGNFIASKAHFKSTPKWLKKFNKEKNISKLKKFSWQPCYPPKSECYNFKDISNYKYTRIPNSIVSTEIKIDKSTDKPFELFRKTPHANQALLDLAKECVNSNLTKENDELLLWVSLSSLDPLGHIFGPQSMEVTDMIYHLDKQLKVFMDFIKNKVGEENALFVLTADHGVAQIPELLNEQGNRQAKRIMIPKLQKKLNDYIKQKYKIKNLVTSITGISLFLDKKKLKNNTKQTRLEILRDLQQLLKNEPGIKNVWLKKDMEKTKFTKYSFENFYKKQIYPKRTGQIILQPQEYCFLTTYPKGTVHRSCYEYDTHVPLFIYQKNRFARNTVDKKVWIPQLTATLAKILNIPKPSSCKFDVLPGVELN